MYYWSPFGIFFAISVCLFVRLFVWFLGACFFRCLSLCFCLFALIFLRSTGWSVYLSLCIENFLLCLVCFVFFSFCYFLFLGFPLLHVLGVVCVILLELFYYHLFFLSVFGFVIVVAVAFYLLFCYVCVHVFVQMLLKGTCPKIFHSFGRIAPRILVFIGFPSSDAKFPTFSTALAHHTKNPLIFHRIFPLWCNISHMRIQTYHHGASRICKNLQIFWPKIIFVCKAIFYILHIQK